MASMDDLWITDAELAVQVAAVQSRWNGAGAALDLFTDADFNPADPASPERVKGDFAIPSLAGYAPKSLVGKCTAPARDEAGVWGFRTETFTFETSDVTGIAVYGCLVSIAGVLVGFRSLGAPLLWSAANPLRLQLDYTHYAALTFKAVVLS